MVTCVCVSGLSVVDSSWLPVFVPSHCQFSKPEDKPLPRYDDQTGMVMCHMTSTFGEHTSL